MWEQLPERTVPLGFAKVGKECAKVYIGAKTVRRWNLGVYKTVTPNIDRRARFLGLQFRRDKKGKRKVMRATTGKGITISCGQYLKALKAVPNAQYPLREDKQGFIIVDMAKPIK